jgi:IS605 OrfB family transposase
MLKTQCLPVLIWVDDFIAQKYNRMMKIKKAFKFRLKPTGIQAQQLHEFAGSTRFLWNKALDLNLQRLNAKRSILYYQELDFWLKLWKRSEEYGFLKKCPAHILQQKLRDLERAFKDGFDKKQPNKRLPKFKKRGVNDSFRFPEPKQIKLDYQHITLPKLGRIRFYRSCAIVGEIKNVTVSRQAGHWYIAIQVELELQSQPSTVSSQAIGLDLGIKQFLTTSTGEHQSPVNSFRQGEKRLGILQRQLSRKKRFSSNWKKQRKKITIWHQKIANIRRDFQHKLSTNICKNHGMIVVEALNIKGMSKSASGDIESPGKQVAAKSGLNKSILDQGWYEFKRQLEYKSYWRGGIVVEVNPQYTSQRCSNCHYVDAQNRQTQEKFVCLQCHNEMNADVNAAKNILAAGHAVMACGASA